MKRKLRNMFLLAGLLAAQQAMADVAVNATNFPDETLRQWASDVANGDGKLSNDEIASVTYVNFSGYGIKNWKGISYFTAITSFWLESDETVTTLNLTGLNALSDVHIDWNPNLTSVTLPKECTSLWQIGIDDNSKLTSVSWPKGPGVKEIHLGSSPVPAFDLTVFTDLEFITIQGNTNWGKTIDISGLRPKYVYIDGTGIETFIAQNNAAWNMWNWNGFEQIKSIDVSNSTVEGMDFNAWPNLETVTIKNCAGLKTLELGGKANLTTLDLTGSYDLESIVLAGDSKLKGFDLKPFTNLNHLNIENCTAWGKTIDISGLRPKYVYIDGTGIETFIAQNNALWNWWGWSGIEHVKHLDSSNDLSNEKSNDNRWDEINGELNGWSMLETLDITNNVELRRLDVACEYLKSIKMDNCPKLIDLRIGHTRVPEFDVAAVLPNLEYLYLDRQDEYAKAEWAWKKLDVSKLTHLKELNVYNNHLSYLNLEDNKEMTYEYGLWEQYPDFQLVKLSANEVGIAVDKAFKGDKITYLKVDETELTPKMTTVDGQQYFLVWNNAATAQSLVGKDKAIYYHYTSGFVPDADSHLQVSGTATSVIKCPSFLKLSAKSVKGTYGEAAPAAPKVTTSELYDGKVSYKSSDEKVVTVAADGTLTVVGAGTATITVSGAETTYRQAPADVTYTVTIAKASPKLQFANAALEMTIQDKVPENALTTGVYDGTVKFTSSDTKVATVSAAGVVTVVAAGEVTITASADATDNCKKPADASYTLTIKKKANTLTIASASITGTYGEKLTAPKATVTTGYDGTLTYKSANEKVVKVSDKGALTVVGAGKTTVTVTAPETAIYQAATAQTYEVVIEKASPVFSFAKSELTAVVRSGVDSNQAEENKLTIGVYDGTVSYASSNPKVAAVDAKTGKVTYLKTGTATITATGAATANCNAAEASYNVTVTVVTAIDGVAADGEGGTWYNVDGTVAKSPVKGRLYIHNGKKEVRR